MRFLVYSHTDTPKGAEMTYKEVEDKIINILKEKFAENVSVDATVEEIGLDSLDRMDLLVALEHGFNIHITEDFENMLFDANFKIQDIVERVCKIKKIAVDVKPKVANIQKPKIQEPIRVVSLNNKSIEFHQGNKTLALNNPKIAQIIQALNQQLVTKR